MAPKQFIFPILSFILIASLASAQNNAMNNILKCSQEELSLATVKVSECTSEINQLVAKLRGPASMNISLETLDLAAYSKSMMKEICSPALMNCIHGVIVGSNCLSEKLNKFVGNVFDAFKIPLELQCSDGYMKKMAMRLKNGSAEMCMNSTVKAGRMCGEKIKKYITQINNDDDVIRISCLAITDAVKCIKQQVKTAPCDKEIIQDTNDVLGKMGAKICKSVSAGNIVAENLVLIFAMFLATLKFL